MGRSEKLMFIPGDTTPNWNFGGGEKREQKRYDQCQRDNKKI